MSDKITVEVVRGALIYAAEEMGIALRKSAYSPNIKERMDHSCAVFDEEGRLVAQAEHIPVHLGSMSMALKEGLKHFDGILGEGDSIVFNDPYISGTHLPDITLISPVYWGNDLIAYVVNKAHHSDVGGVTPGSLPGDSTEIFQEGVVIPPVKLVEDGEVKKDVLNVILSNVRDPDVRLGDLKAQIAANNLGVRRVKEIAERYGVEIFKGCVEEILNHSERMMRAEIEEIPDGEYEAEDYLEDVGVGNEIARIRVKVKVKGDEIEFDYDGTDPQVDGPLNAVLGVTVAGVYYVLLCVTDPTIPINDGCHRPVRIRVPEGCLLNPRKPAAVSGGNVETSQRNVDVLFKALSNAIPDKVCAAGQGTMNNVCVGGVNPKTGRQWVFYETIGGGCGGRRGLDGVDGVHVHMTNTMNTPIEVIEREYPILFVEYSFRENSCGAGKWRGGCGIVRSWRLLAPKATLTIQAERQKLRPWGLFGGKPGMSGEAFIIKPNGEKVKLRSKCTVTIGKGDIFVIRTPGGGGYGNPLERDGNLILRDVENGLITREIAERDYGVIVEKGIYETRRISRI